MLICLDHARHSKDNSDAAQFIVDFQYENIDNGHEGSEDYQKKKNIPANFLQQ